MKISTNTINIFALWRHACFVCV